jgi:DNA-binding GntR family transcriptional regulator
MALPIEPRIGISLSNFRKWRGALTNKQTGDEDETSQRQRDLQTEEEVRRQVIQAVMDHKLPPGAKLDEDGLADIFGISRTRIRKVISLLANEGVVTQRLNHGAFISKPSISEARDIFVARRAIEQLVVKLICALDPAPDFKALRDYVRREEDAYHKHGGATHRLSGDFHLILADVAGNAVLVPWMQQVVLRTNLVQALYGPRQLCLVHEHEAILASLEARDVERSLALTDQHQSSIENACDLTDRSQPVVDLAAIFPLAPGTRR